MIAEETLCRSVAEDIRALDFMEKEEEIRRKRKADRQAKQHRKSVTVEPMDLDVTQVSQVTLEWESTTADALLRQGGIRDDPKVSRLSVIPHVEGRSALNAKQPADEKSGSGEEQGKRTEPVSGGFSLDDVMRTLTGMAAQSQRLADENKKELAMLNVTRTRQEEKCSARAHNLREQVLADLAQVATDLMGRTDRKFGTIRAAIRDGQEPTNETFRTQLATQDVAIIDMIDKID